MQRIRISDVRCWKKTLALFIDRDIINQFISIEYLHSGKMEIGITVKLFQMGDLSANRIDSTPHSLNESQSIVM